MQIDESSLVWMQLGFLDGSDPIDSALQWTISLIQSCVTDRDKRDVVVRQASSYLWEISQALHTLAPTI
ncbi:hypothetical protein ACSBR1_036998 [Camellia fascicularis]